MKKIVIVGAGHAGVQVADSLRKLGFSDTITLLSGETEWPYQRPPLSKSFMLGEDADILPLRGENFFAENRIDFRRDCVATELDASARRVRLRDGTTLAYDELVLATGAANRKLTLGEVPGGAVQDLRTARDARELKKTLARVHRLVVVGGGFVGLEIAAAARQGDIAVTVLEVSGRLMGRVLSPVMSTLFAEMHRRVGVDLRFREKADAVDAVGPEGYRVRTNSGAVISTDVVLWSAGALPNTGLASGAGLATDRGIVVDTSLHTSAPHVWAIGDCARYPSRYATGLVRLESVQNAIGQAQHVAKALLKGPKPYEEVPWFWTIQGEYKLTIAGIFESGDATVWHEYGRDRGSAFCFRDGRLTAVESLNRPADHVAARAILGMKNGLTPAQVLRPHFELKAFRRALLAECAG